MSKFDFYSPVLYTKQRNTMSKVHSRSSTTTLAIAIATAVSLASLVTLQLSHVYFKKKQHQDSEQWEKRRQEERKGRIRAEKKLRSVLNQQRHASNSQSSENANYPHGMKLDTIGTIVSPYTKRMGTPRQGALVPNSRGFIQFSKDISPEAVDGINEYSHIWVIFQFHANTSLATSKKSKIRPPRGGGKKVGMLATRSPHRPNALGLSLVKMDRWEPSTRRLYINALDLCNGTPVFDIKPFIHWDIPGDEYDKEILKLPDWVENKYDVLPNVEFIEAAETSLAKQIKENHLAPLYPSHDDTALEGAKKTLLEILAQDPRTSHKGVSKNQRGSLSGSESYRILFCKVEVEFTVAQAGATINAVCPYDPEEENETKES
jgi:tRNA-Thr(GGU) m(6)t(6)A37 methyltransferase TsaA